MRKTCRKQLAQCNSLKITRRKQLVKKTRLKATRRKLSGEKLVAKIEKTTVGGFQTKFFNVFQLFKCMFAVNILVKHLPLMLWKHQGYRFSQNN